MLTPSNSESPNPARAGIRNVSTDSSFAPDSYVPGLTFPVEVWRPKIPIPQAILFDVDSTLFKSEALHDFGHHRLVSEVYLQLPPGGMWSRDSWTKWLINDKPAYPLVAEHPEMRDTPLHHRILLTEGSCFFRAETEVIQRLHQRLLYLSKIEGTGVPRGIAARFLDDAQYKEQKTHLMIDAMTGDGPRHQLELIQGAHSLMDLVLAHKIPFALGTGSPRKIIEAMLSQAGWREHVKHSVTADDLWCAHQKTFRPGKPDPLTFNLAFQGIKDTHPEIKSKSRVYVFEDQAKGAHAARRGGFTALLCPDPTNGKSIAAHVEELRRLERETPCGGQPPVIVAQHSHLGWGPFIEKIFLSRETSEHKAPVV
jgi:beta-phosphoglucomutase-like phosphatase (HAD superfamily)